MAYKAIEIAEYIINLSASYGDTISPLKLQKILYYTQGSYLALKNEPAFSDEILAWKHGPVVYSVYSKYKHYGRDNIRSFAHSSTIKESDQHIIKEIYSKYRDYTASQLVDKTHSEPPWLNTNDDDIISEESIRDYFSNVVYCEDKLFSDRPIESVLPNNWYDPEEDEVWSKYE
jgi:uncharacterized phage-associated protein